jgi:3-methylcrotonyl-CoA carboxylase beta subunit
VPPRCESFDEYKAEYGQTLVCGYGRLGGFPVGVIANQHHRVKPAEGRFSSAA